MKNVWKPGKWMNSLHFFWGLTKIGFNLNQYISSTFSDSKMFFRFVQNMTVKIVFKIIPLAFWALNVENKCQISLRWSSVVSLMIRSPSKWSKFHEFRRREFVYFSVRNHSVGDWRGDKTLVMIDHTNFARLSTTTVLSGLLILLLEWWFSWIEITIADFLL